MAPQTAERSKRLYTTMTDEVAEALDAAPEAHLVVEGASAAERLRAWTLYGYHHWLAQRMRERKLEAYRELAQDEERIAAIRAANEQAIEAGLI